MRLRDRPPRRIGRLWMAGCAVEALVAPAFAAAADGLGRLLLLLAAILLPIPFLLAPVTIT